MKNEQFKENNIHESLMTFAKTNVICVQLQVVVLQMKDF